MSDPTGLTVPDTIPTVKIIETTALEHEAFGTHDEVVTKMIAQGWEVSEQFMEKTSVVHPLIKGTVRHIFK